MIFVICFVAVICGIVSAVIANSKGRSGVGWFFGGLLLSIIGVIIIAILPKKIKKYERQKKREEVRDKDAIIEKGKIVKYGNIDVKLLNDVPIEVLRKTEEKIKSRNLEQEVIVSPNERGEEESKKYEIAQLKKRIEKLEKEKKMPLLSSDKPMQKAGVGGLITKAIIVTLVVVAVLSILAILLSYSSEILVWERRGGLSQYWQEK